MSRETVNVKFNNMDFIVRGDYYEDRNDFEFLTIMWEGKDVTRLWDNIFHNHIEEIEEEVIKSIKVRKEKTLKNTLLNLKSGDEIFGIRLSMGPHLLVESENIVGEVDIIDYCKVTDNDLRWYKRDTNSSNNEDDFRISISHGTKPFGISRTLSMKEDGGKHYLLSIDTMMSGYDSFYTLKPETWKEDIKKAYEEKMVLVNKYHQEKLNRYKQKLDWFLEGEELISEHLPK